MVSKEEERECIRRDFERKQPGMITALGHHCCIFLHNDETIVVPFSNKQIGWAIDSVQRLYDTLKSSGDFQEEKEFDVLLFNLRRARSLLEVHQINIKQGRR